MTTTHGARGALAAVYAATFISFLDNFAMLPTIAPFARTLGADGAGVGLAVAAYSLANIPGNVVGGVLADRLGRRRVAIGGIAAAAVALACYPLADGLGTLLALRAVHGFAGGVHVAALFTIAGDLAPAAGGGRTMGRLGAVIGGAAVFAPAAAGLLRQVAGFTITFLAVAAAMAVGALLLQRRLGETAPRAQAGRPSRPLPPRARRRLLAACTAVFGFTTGFGVLTGFLPTRVEALGAPAGVSGGLFAALALVAVAVMLSRVADRVDAHGARRPLVGGLTLVAVALGVLAASSSLVAALAGCLVFGLGFGAVFPAATATAASGPAEARGRALGAFNAVYSLGFIVVPPLAGRLADAGGSPYLLAAGVSAVCVAGVGLLARGDRLRSAACPP